MILNYIVDFVFDPNCTEYQKNLYNDLLTKKPTHAFLNIAWEVYQVNESLLAVDDFLYSHGIPVTWIVWDAARAKSNWQQLKCPVQFINFFLWRSYNEIVVKKKNLVNSQWNPNAERWLFLTGKPHKLNRVGLLHLLHSRNLLDKCDYSFFMTPGMREATKKFLPDLYDDEFDQFVSQHQCSVDKISPVFQETNMHYGGIPYDPDIYKNSLFRLVSESNTHCSPATVTEKTYITLINKNPFVIAGDYRVCSYLKSLGFATFDQLFDIPTYDNQIVVHKRLNSVVDHVEQWLHGNFNKTEVADMVEHNYKRFVELGQQIKQQFEQETGVDIDLAIDTTDPTV